LAGAATGDAARGERLLHERGCVSCHKVDGEGGTAAPDLGKRPAQNWTPAYLAGVIWNHARFGSADAVRSTLSEEQAADLFAYFASRRFFEPRGDAGRGKEVFAGKHCNDCHGISEALPAGASPVAQWPSLHDPIAFALEMWNRPVEMVPASGHKKSSHPRLTSDELNDLLVYLENLPATRGKQVSFRLLSVEAGRNLFQTKGCADCHRGRLSLENRPSHSMMADISAAMWNHPASNGDARTPLSYDEMSGLVSYLWSLDDRGDQNRGRVVFERKKCTTCHDTEVGGGERSTISLARRREVLPASMVAALAQHGPSVQAEMSAKGVAWPRFGGSEMTDLVAYLETKAVATPSEVAHTRGGSDREDVPR
jgi:mono/diheme cytochrome c family protein